jgi:hypothetical protein
MANPVNGPISASAPQSSLVNATGVGVTFNTRYPFDKLDSTNTKSFQVITLFFSVDPPNPDGTIATYKRTQIYQFAHGYKYVPASWFLVSTDNFATTVGAEGVVLNVNNPDPTASSAVLIINVDSTNVTFYIDKYYNAGALGPPPPPSILGFFVAIRSYVFVNDLLGTDVPSQP